MPWLVARPGFRRARHEVVDLYWESGRGDEVPTLAWFFLSSMAPLALGLTALAAVVLGDYARAQELSTRISEVLTKDVQDQVVHLILRTQHDSPLLIGSAIRGDGVDEFRRCRSAGAVPLAPPRPFRRWAGARQDPHPRRGGRAGVLLGAGVTAWVPLGETREASPAAGDRQSSRRSEPPTQARPASLAASAVAGIMAATGVRATGGDSAYAIPTGRTG
jgi:hypothetical protein